MGGDDAMSAAAMFEVPCMRICKQAELAAVMAEAAAVMVW